MAKTKEKRTGMIFNIQKFSVHDGPGIRDLVFLKGCPLKCKWCSNPESQNLFPEIAYIQNRCIGVEKCSYCIKACPMGAIQQSEVDVSFIKIDRQKCNNCGICAEICPAKAITLFGESITVEDVIQSVLHDNISWRSSGGITLSGGELLLQADFVQELLKECRSRGIDTAIETSGYASWTELEKVCEHANLIFYDIKSMDPEKHKAFTGVNNALILENLLKISNHFPETPLIVRTPLIPGFNDSEDDIDNIVKFICQVKNLKDYEIMPYHAFGEAKYRQLGREYLFGHIKAPNKDYVEILNKRVRTLLNFG